MSTIYYKFVIDENDVEGLLAYSLFKRHEIQANNQYINAYKATHNGQSPPNIKKLDPNTVTPSILNTFRREASNILLETTANLMGKKISEIENILNQAQFDVALKKCLNDKEYLNTHKNLLKENLTDQDLLSIYESSLKKLKQRKWTTIGLNIASSFIFALLIAILVFVIYLYKPAYVDIIRSLF